MTGRPAPWRRLLVLSVVRRRSSWATAYARRQVRLADEDLAAAGHLAAEVDEAAEAAERQLLQRMAERHQGLRREFYHAVRAAERRLARSGAYELQRAGLVTDPATAKVLRYVADEVGPELDRIAGELGIRTD